MEKNRLFEPLQVGALQLPNRVLMSPLTRCRASEGRVPSDLMREYYRQRSGFGMIISEATSVDPMGVGYPDTPSIWSEEQVAGWAKVVEGVHEAGGKILCQLWHVGRISAPQYLEGKLPLSASAVQADGHVSLVRPKQEYVTPRALEISEIEEIVQQFRKGAVNAKKAGFDGVEIHGANGYLIDQFLQDSTNQRSDRYGGAVENRMRFMMEIVDEVVDVWGADRVGMHLAPRGDAHDMGDSDLRGLFIEVAKQLGGRGLAFICSRESYDGTAIGPEMKDAFGGVYIANEGFDKKQAEAAIAEGRADAVAFGQLAIANPDLPRRMAEGAKLNTPDQETFYGSGPKGYTDYPFLEGS